MSTQFAWTDKSIFIVKAGQKNKTRKLPGQALIDHTEESEAETETLKSEHITEVGNEVANKIHKAADAIQVIIIILGYIVCPF